MPTWGTDGRARSGGCHCRFPVPCWAGKRSRNSLRPQCSPVLPCQLALDKWPTNGIVQAYTRGRTVPWGRANAQDRPPHRAPLGTHCVVCLAVTPETRTTKRKPERLAVFTGMRGPPSAAIRQHESQPVPVRRALTRRDGKRPTRHALHNKVVSLGVRRFQGSLSIDSQDRATTLASSQARAVPMDVTDAKEGFKGQTYVLKCCAHMGDGTHAFVVGHTQTCWDCTF